MREAVVASYARTPIGKAYRGSLNATRGATLGRTPSPPPSNEPSWSLLRYRR
jgi:hypothetical protein